jgi:hypothetical protein
MTPVVIAPITNVIKQQLHLVFLGTSSPTNTGSLSQPIEINLDNN